MKLLTHSMAVTMMFLALPCIAENTAAALPVTLTISAPETVTVGDDIIIDLKLKNVSTQRVTVPWGMAARLDVIIQDEHSNVPPLKPGFWPRAGSGATHPIEPGETFEIIPSAPLGKYDLAPGKYFVKIKYPLEHLQRPAGPNDKMVESNEITITVLPWKPHAPQ